MKTLVKICTMALAFAGTLSVHAKDPDAKVILKPSEESPIIQKEIY